MRREARVGLRRRGVRQTPHRLGAAPDLQVVKEEVARDRDEQQPRVRRKLVVDDAGERDRALPFATGLFLGRKLALVGDQAARIDQQRIATGRDVMRPQVEPVLGLGAALQVGDELAVRREAGAAQRGAGEVRSAEETLQRQPLRWRRRRCCGDRDRRSDEEGGEGGEGGERVARAVRHGRVPSSNMGVLNGSPGIAGV